MFPVSPVCIAIVLVETKVLKCICLSDSFLLCVTGVLLNMIYITHLISTPLSHGPVDVMKHWDNFTYSHILTWKAEIQVIISLRCFTFFPLPRRFSFCFLSFVSCLDPTCFQGTERARLMKILKIIINITKIIINMFMKIINIIIFILPVTVAGKRNREEMPLHEM